MQDSLDDLSGPAEGGLDGALAFVFDPRRVEFEESASDGAPPDPVARDAPEYLDDGEGRYRLLAEVGHGGMGVVWHARDERLSRELAVKVLRDRHANREGLEDRFLAEARITGQLQHPGIVPVHDVGRRGDRRPYFTMKLVRGETFADLLRRRRAPYDERARDLDVFAKICEAVAYAHSRGVVHRDLKPANVMVGAFGEVQVLDWGLAKALDTEAPPTDGERSEAPVVGRRTEESVSGSVFGTPSYMSPEQAQGDADAVDERSDVFSLGAILLEVLTGLPPYVGESSRVVRSMAADADQAEARARLEEADVAPSLAEIVRACLAVDPADRPADASLVAKRVRDHLAESERRAATSRVEAERSRVEATAARRERKLALALSAALSTAIVLLVGGVVLWKRAEAERTARATQFERAFASASERRDVARAGGPRDVVAWQQALARAQATAAMLTGASESQDHGRARALVDEARDGVRVATENGEILDALAACERGHLFRPSDAATRRDRVERAFASAGVGFFEAAVTVVAAELRERGLGDALAAALDPWGTLYLYELEDGSKGEHHERARRVFDVAEHFDSTPLTRSLRRILLAGSTSALAEFARSDALLEARPQTIALVVDASMHWGRSDQRAAQIVGREKIDEILVEALARHPLDGRLSRLQAHNIVFHRLAEASPDELRTALAAARATLAVRPDDASSWHEAAEAVSAVHGGERAIPYAERAVELEPSSHMLREVLAAFLAAAGRHEDSLREFEAVLGEPEAGGPGPDTLGRLRLLRSAVHQGDPAAFLAGAVAYTERFEQEQDRKAALSSLALDHFALGNYEAMLESLDEVLSLDETRYEAHFFRGASLRPLGRYEEAIAAYRRAHEHGPTRTFALDQIRWAEQSHELALRIESALASGEHGSTPKERTDLARVAAATGHADRAREIVLRLEDGDPGAVKRAGADLFAARIVAEDVDALDANARRRVLEWLRSDLPSLRATAMRFRKANEFSRATNVILPMFMWQFEPFRSEDGLARLPAVEREAWEAYWEELAEIRQLWFVRE